MQNENKVKVSLLLFYLLVTLCQTKILLERLNLTQLISTHTITFSSSFTNEPQFTFFIQAMNLNGPEMKIFHNINRINKRSATIEFQIQNNGMGISQYQYIQIGLFFSDQRFLEFGIIETTSTNQVNLSYNRSHGCQYELRFLTHSIPFTYSILSCNETNAIFSLTTLPMAISGKTSIGFIVVQMAYISNKILVFFQQFTSNSADFIITFDKKGYLSPQSQNTALVLTGYEHTDSQIQIQEYSNHQYDGNMIAIGYYLQNTTTKLQAFVLSHNQNYMGCPDTYFLKYMLPFNGLPAVCGSCDVSCNTCVSSPDDNCFTNQNFCTSCGQLRYFQQIIPNSNYGKCICLIGLQINSLGQCIPCNFNCLGFFVQFIRAATTPQFILTFTHNQVTLDIQLSDNLQIYVDQVLTKPLNLTIIRNGMYKIQLQPQDMKSCQIVCNVSFLIADPQVIYTKQKYLTTQFVSMFIHNYYTVNDQLPQQLNEAFLISSFLIGATAATGSASMIKMLFQVQQMIQFHKYLNLDIPVVFKEFLQALSVFKFLDFSSILPLDLNAQMRKLSANDMDNKGPIKAVYYQNGANFYKNIIPPIFTFCLILLLNFLIYLLFKAIPCQLFNRGSEKLRLRWLIILSDLTQTLIVPIILFGSFQYTYIILSLKFYWVYALLALLSGVILVFPFVVTIYVYTCDKRGIVKKQIYQDLFQDVQLTSRVSYISYIVAFLRKFLFAMFLNPQLPGLIQVALLIMLNMSYFFIMVYVILNKLFTSRIKLLTRIVNILSIIALQTVIMIYNMNYSQIDKMIEMGIICTYLTIITTITGILQIIIRIGQIIFQKVNDEEGQKKQQKKQTQNPIRCNIGKPLDFIYQMDDQQSQNQKAQPNQSILDLGTNLIQSSQKTDINSSKKSGQSIIRPSKPFRPLKRTNSILIRKDSKISDDLNQLSQNNKKSQKIKDKKKLYPDQQEQDNSIPSIQIQRRKSSRKKKRIQRAQSLNSSQSSILSPQK